MGWLARGFAGAGDSGATCPGLRRAQAAVPTPSLAACASRRPLATSRSSVIRRARSSSVIHSVLISIGPPFWPVCSFFTGASTPKILQRRSTHHCTPFKNSGLPSRPSLRTDAITSRAVVSEHRVFRHTHFAFDGKGEVAPVTRVSQMITEWQRASATAGALDFSFADDFRSGAWWG
jgi:hypothetical protein